MARAAITITNSTLIAAAVVVWPFSNLSKTRIERMRVSEVKRNSDGGQLAHRQHEQQQDRRDDADAHQRDGDVDDGPGALAPSMTALSSRSLCSCSIEEEMER